MNGFKLAAATAAALAVSTTMGSASPLDFAGFYVGAHAGYSESSADFASTAPAMTVQNPPVAVAFIFFGGGGGGNELTSGGSMGGLQAGFNFVNGNFVWGVETDVSLTGADPDGACPFDGSLSCEVDIGLISTLRPRVGYATDNFLFYVTGGIAGAQFDVEANGGAAGNSKGGALGWTAGAGVEYLVGDAVGVRLEYRYMRFGDFDKISSPGGSSIDVEVHTIMGGLNFYF